MRPKIVAFITGNAVHLALRAAPPPQHVDDEHDQRNDEKQMNQPPGNVKDEPE
jgi:hypothetical protein